MKGIDLLYCTVVKNTDLSARLLGLKLFYSWPLTQYFLSVPLISHLCLDYFPLSVIKHYDPGMTQERQCSLWGL